MQRGAARRGRTREWQLFSPALLSTFLQRASRHGTSAAGMPHPVMLGMVAMEAGSQQAQPSGAAPADQLPVSAVHETQHEAVRRCTPARTPRELRLRVLLTRLRCSPPARQSHQMGDYRGVSSQARLFQAKNVVEPANAWTTAVQGSGSVVFRGTQKAPTESCPRSVQCKCWGAAAAAVPGSPVPHYSRTSHIKIISSGISTHSPT
jgi:hypothetical protein